LVGGSNPFLAIKKQEIEYRKKQLLEELGSCCALKRVEIDRGE
jgi:hypothetical protein